MLKRLFVLSLLALALIGSACATPTPMPTPVSPTQVPNLAPAVAPTTAAAAANDYTTMAQAAAKFLTSGKPVVTTADQLYEALNDGNAANDPFILDIRSAADFANGCIKGAVNIPFAQVFKSENLAKLPKDKPVIVVCYTGHAAAMTSFTLNAMGYNTTALKYSMMAWSKNDVVLGAHKRFPAEQKDYVVDRAAVALPVAAKPPTISTGKSASVDMIAAQADKFLSSGKAPVLLPDKVFEVLNDGDAANDPFILDVRAATDYAKGHVKGAVNIPFAQAFKPENLAKYPTDKQIVVFCYTGHIASMTSFYLNILGYDAVSSQWGVMGWSKNDALLGANKRFPSDQKDYPLAK